MKEIIQVIQYVKKQNIVDAGNEVHVAEQAIDKTQNVSSPVVDLT